MPEFVFLYRNTPERLQDMSSSPERAQQSMQKWRAWFKDLGERGYLKNIGQPLERAGKVVGGTKKTVTDGPYAETKDLIGGFSIVEAKDLDHAAQLASGCPITDAGGSVEVRPVMRLDM
jgi:hypothetical protein